MKTTLDAPMLVAVKPHGDFTLSLTFENGETRRMDMRPYLESEVFGPLKDLSFFAAARVVYGSLEWPGERDLGHDMLYAASTPE